MHDRTVEKWMRDPKVFQNIGDPAPHRRRLPARLDFFALPAGRRTSLVRRSGRRRTRAQRRVLLQRTAIIAAIAALAALVLGLVFAGSPSRLAAGVRVAGVDVGGKTPREAQGILKEKADALA